jgi:hypothetical protein
MLGGGRGPRACIIVDTVNDHMAAGAPITNISNGNMPKTKRNFRSTYGSDYAPRFGHNAKRIAHEICVTGFQCCCDLSRLFLLGVEKVGIVSSWARRLMDLSLRLSSKCTSFAPGKL